MSYYHHHFQNLNDCPVSVAFTDTVSCFLSTEPVRQFKSIIAAAEYILDEQRNLESVVLTAHSPAGDVDLCQDELSLLIALTNDLRYCQD